MKMLSQTYRNISQRQNLFGMISNNQRKTLEVAPRLLRLLRFATLAAAAITSTNLYAQDSATVETDATPPAESSRRQRPVRLETPEETQVDQATLSHGMPRRRVLELLGPPAFESVIGSLGRTRVEYDDDVVLMFEDHRLIAIKTVDDPQTTEDGNLFLQRSGTTDLTFAPDLILEDTDPLPYGEQRRVIDDNFYVKQTSGTTDAYDIPFTPVTPECLLDDCPGCDNCNGGSPTRVPRKGSPQFNKDPCGTCGNRTDWNLWLTIDALFLDRDADDFQTTFLQGGTTAGASLLSHGLTPGLKATLDANLTGETAAQLVYIGAHQWGADASNSNLLPPGLGTLATNESYRAELDDFQVNLVHRPEGKTWSLLAGVRFGQQSDEFSSALSGTLPSGAARNELNLQGEAVNRLIGLQVGASQTWRCGRFDLFGQIKLGAVHNEIDQSGPSFVGALDLTSNPAATDIATFTDEDEEVSFVGDFEFSIRYQIFGNSWLRLGYQGLVFSDIAQVAQQDGQSATADTLAYNGIFGGIEIRR